MVPPTINYRISDVVNNVIIKGSKVITAFETLVIT